MRAHHYRWRNTHNVGVHYFRIEWTNVNMRVFSMYNAKNMCDEEKDLLFSVVRRWTGFGEYL